MSNIKESASIYDLARLTGVSTGTISRVFNSRSGVANETRAAVMQAARKFNYRPQTVVKRTTIAVITDTVKPEAYGGYVTFMLSSFITQISERNLSVEIFTQANIATMGEYFIDGVICMTWNDDVIAALNKLRDIPVVMVNRMDLPQFSAVATDHYASAATAVSYFLERGHRRIAFITGEKDWGASERVRGYGDALRNAGIDVDENMIGYTSHSLIHSTIKRLLSASPTAIFIAGEDFILETIYMLTDVFTLKIPDDISVIGLENPLVSRFVSPPHTTVSASLDQLSTESINLLLELIREKATETRNMIIKNGFIERNSVKNITSSNPKG